VFKYDIGVGVNYRVQSGSGFTRVISASLPNAGTVQFFLDDLDNQYSETVPILDVRLDTTVVFGRDRVGVMLDADQPDQRQPGVERQHRQRHALQPHHRHARPTRRSARVPVRVLSRLGG